MSTTPTKTKPKKIGKTVLAKYFHDNGYEPIPPHVFYREMFPPGELAPFHEDGSYDPNVWRYNGIILHRTNQTKTVVKHNDFLREDLVMQRNVFKKHLVYDDLIAIDDWYKKQIQDNAHVGCRYYRLYTLAQYGAKCDIPFDEVKQDCIKIGGIFKLVGDVPLEDWEIEKAYAAYYDYRAFESTIDFINSKAHLSIEKNKRNGQKQHDHLQADVLYNKITGRKTINVCKANRELTLQTMRENGDILGRPTKQKIVADWRAAHPNGKKADCVRDTGLTKPTVYKWWDAV